MGYLPLSLVVITGLAIPSIAEVSIVVDNSDSGFTVLSGTWNSGTLTGQYGTNYRYKSSRSFSPYNFVQWQSTLPSSGQYEVAVWYPPATNQPDNARYTVYYDGGSQTITVNQTLNQASWVVLGTFTFSAGTNGQVQLSDQAQRNKTVLADAVRFRLLQPVYLTMAITPAGTGSTVPAAGGPYTKGQGEVVSIVATANTGYMFSRWETSNGLPVAEPTASSTTVTMDISKTVTAIFVPPPPTFRGFFVDVFHPGLQSSQDIDEMVNYAMAGGYNAIIAEVLAYHDGSGGNHGAYWRSEIVPPCSAVTSIFDPLGYLITLAHSRGIEVHPWMVAYRVSSGWPPPGNAFLANHPEWLMVPSASIGSVAAIGGVFTFDPGNPEVQDYLISIVRELVTHYDVDGIHWDYIRYTQQDAGYPTDLGYSRSGLARFQRNTGRSDVPSPTGDTAWDDFRRQTIDELIRRCQVEITATIKPSRLPLRHTASLVPWGDAPADFSQTSAYRLFQNWEKWTRMGWLDAACPMLYYREHCTDQYQWYRNWVNAAVLWRNSRHLFPTQGNYLNGMANSITQMRYALNQGVNGLANYSYYATHTAETDCDGVDSPVSDFSWYDYIASNLYSYTSTPPSMPWRNPATATEGMLYGQVTDSVTGNPIDNAIVQVGSLDSVRTDGNGYYVVSMISSDAAGTAYDVTASHEASTITHKNVLIMAGGVRRNDFYLGILQPPRVIQQPASQAVCPSAAAVFTCMVAAEGNPVFLWQKEGSDLQESSVYFGVATGTLTVAPVELGNAGSFRCIVTNAAGTAISESAILSVKPATTVTQQPQSANVPYRSTVKFMIEATGEVPLQYRWQKNGSNLAEGGHYTGTTSATLTILNANENDIGTYRCLVTALCGSIVSDDANLTLAGTAPFPADLDGDNDVDQDDFGRLQACLMGSGSIPSVQCENADLDGDQDVDANDIVRLRQCMSGADMPANPACLP